MTLQSEEEKQVLQCLGKIHQKILDWGLRANVAELVQAVHVIQGFIIQHMLERVAPEEFGRPQGGWYKKKEERDSGIAEALDRFDFNRVSGKRRDIELAENLRSVLGKTMPEEPEAKEP